MKPPIKLLQERDFGQKINAVFEFIGQNFKPLMTCMLYIAGPVSVIAGIAMGVYQSDLMSFVTEPTAVGDPNDPLNMLLGRFTVSYLVAIIFLVIASIVAALVVYAYVLIYEQQGNSATPTITPNAVWDIVKNNFLKYIGISIIVGFLVIIGLVLLIVPGIYVSVVFSLLFFCMLREDLGLESGMRRVFYLITDKWWSTLGLLIIVSFIQSVLGYIFQLPQFAFMLLKAFKILEGDISMIVSTITGIIGTLGSILLSCMVNLALVFQYFNLVERRDGTGMLNAIDAIGKPETPRTDLREEEY